MEKGGLSVKGNIRLKKKYMRKSESILTKFANSIFHEIFI